MADAKTQAKDALASNEEKALMAASGALKKELASAQAALKAAEGDEAKATAEAVVGELRALMKDIGLAIAEIKKAARKKATPAKKAKTAGKAAKAKGGKKRKVFEGEEIEADREIDFGEWYRQVLLRSEMIDYSDISGCFILRPMSMYIWDEIKAYLDKLFKQSGVLPCYFPLLVTERALMTEKDNFEDFCPEVAWVTRSGQSEMDEPLAIRPTSEAVMYANYAKWIKSYRDLPLRLNQWCNVVRWEFKEAVPFIRSREFLWQEGHSAWETQQEADKEVREILGYYQSAYEDLLAVPVIKGMKTEKEKFAGADYTTTVEAFVPPMGRGVQAATSHCLGTMFSREEFFNITFEDAEGKLVHPIQTSWGYTTRSIGVMIMVHGDNAGLVLPPRVAPTQVVIVPLHYSEGKKEVDNSAIDKKAEEVKQQLLKAGIRAHVDLRTGYQPLRRFIYWEVRGTPIRLEIGEKEVQEDTVTLCRRDNLGKKQFGTPCANLGETIQQTLDDIHDNMLKKARAKYDDCTANVTAWKDFVPRLNEKKMCLVPFCMTTECEEDIKKASAAESEERLEKMRSSGVSEEELKKVHVGAAKSLCCPFGDDGKVQEAPVGSTCVRCGEAAKVMTLFGRSY